jgi:hypothetical protein
MGKMLAFPSSHSRFYSCKFGGLVAMHEDQACELNVDISGFEGLVMKFKNGKDDLY